MAFLQSSCSQSGLSCLPDLEADPLSTEKADPDDPDRLLNEWLGQLDNLAVGLDNCSSRGSAVPRRFALPGPELSAPRIDSYRFSMANLEDSQDVDLDAILGELCALESVCEQAMSVASRAAAEVATVSSQSSSPGSPATNTEYPSITQCQTPESTKKKSVEITRTAALPNSGHHCQTPSLSSSEGGSSARGSRVEPSSDQDHIARGDGGRTESPDNDSAFSDNVSMLSSESSASSGGSGGRTNASSKSSGLGMAPSPSQMNHASRIKAEKIRIALEKMREASVKKLFIKAFSADDSTKSLLVDEKMTCAYVTRLLADKNHVLMDPHWAIVEHLPDLYMERLYEDHELLVDNLMMWTRDSKNKLLFLDRPDKYALFAHPEKFLINQASSDMDREFDDDAKSTLLEEFFSSSGVGVPEVEGQLYMKAESKKGWRKYYFALRASGLYYALKEKAKSPRDLLCLATFDVNEVYYGIGWKKKYKAPTDYCFAIKHPRLQQPKSNKFIKFLCAEDKDSLARWLMGIRIAKHGRILQENYNSLVDDIAQEDLDQLAHARSCSLSSMATGIGISPSTLPSPSEPTPTMPNVNRCTLARRDSARSRGSSSSSSGCLSVDEPAAFEADFPPTGTIKRKPSLNPKLPLTSITRQLKEVGEAVSGSNDGTLTRRQRRSVFDDSGSNCSTLTRHRASSIDSSGCSNTSSTTPTWPEEGGSNCSTLTKHREYEITADSPTRSATSCASTWPKEIARHCNIEISPRTIIASSQKEADDEMENLLLPPPPADMLLPTPSMENLSDCLPLPPPPPEFFKSMCSLDYLPPLPDLHEMDSMNSLTPFPPPPPQATITTQAAIPVQATLPPPTPPKPSAGCLSNSMSQPNNDFPPLSQIQRRASESTSVDRASSSSLWTSPQRRVSDIASNPNSTYSPPSSLHRQVSILRPKKKISFGGVDDKPTPPRRSESTRLSSGPPPLTVSPKKLCAPNSSVTPPHTDFLKDLQRVMRRKWQVAQKCKLDLTTTPHEVLGFRDPPPPDYRETNVSNWLQEHYGAALYENIGRPEEESQQPNEPTSRLSLASKKRPPPPPPVRSETTQLSSTGAAI